MAASAEQVQRLRRMVAEPLSTTYSDDSLRATIERFPHLDEHGTEPFTWDYTTDPPTQETNDSWVPTYDLAAAAAEVWDEKAAALTTNYDFDADGASYKRSQSYQQTVARARYYRARRIPKSVPGVVWPPPGTTDDKGWIGNLPESDD